MYSQLLDNDKNYLLGTPNSFPFQTKREFTSLHLSGPNQTARVSVILNPQKQSVTSGKWSTQSSDRIQSRDQTDTT